MFYCRSRSETNIYDELFFLNFGLRGPSTVAQPLFGRETLNVYSDQQLVYSRLLDVEQIAMGAEFFSINLNVLANSSVSAVKKVGRSVI